MTHSNYNRFLKVCKEQLNSNKYYVQEGLVDWPLDYSKIKLRDTILKEPEGYIPATGEQGIFVDVFKLDNVSSNRFCILAICLCKGSVMLSVVVKNL